MQDRLTRALAVAWVALVPLASVAAAPAGPPRALADSPPAAPPVGSTSLLAALPPVTLPNGLALAPDGALYVSDSARGAVWRVGADGEASRWVQDELLEGDLQAG